MMYVLLVVGGCSSARLHARLPGLERFGDGDGLPQDLWTSLTVRLIQGNEAYTLGVYLYVKGHQQSKCFTCRTNNIIIGSHILKLGFSLNQLGYSYHCL